MNLIDVTHDNCVGCRLCEMFCSLVHEGECSTAKSRIKIHRDEEFGNNLVSVCLHCTEAYCLESCAYGALSRDEKTGAVVVDEQSCTACEACILACPVGGMSLNTDKNVAIKCDLCGGDPECAKVCFRRALCLTETDPASPERRALMAESSDLLAQEQA
ncbi:MAG: 4Fe-4S dicluster domain-containing protein [Desulfobacterales bacterium]|nr:4Fe-4S dicluster domain-containing protein [Desulfobacterales bacterium]